MRRIVFLGPPGAGKGTQATELARRLGVPHLSTGELLRAAVVAQSPLGRAAKEHIDAGRLVPDDLVLEILKERLARPDARPGFVLDGYPRTVLQAAALERFATPDRVVLFDIPEPLLLERLTGRRTCPQCGSVYNVVTRPPRIEGHCDHDGTELTVRSDDREEAVRTRIKVYLEQTHPLIAHYRELGVLRSIDAVGAPDQVRDRLNVAIE